MSKSRTPPLVGTLLLCASVPVAATVLQQLLVGDWRAEHYPLHALAGGLGAFSALTLAVQLRTLRVYQRGDDYHIWVACALLSLGLLDAAHGAIRDPQLFVWLNSIAMLTGGVLFSLVWLPSKAAFRHEMQILPLVVAAAVALLTTISIARPEWRPSMIDGGHFTTTAKALVYVGTIGFLVAATYFGLTYWRTGSNDRLLFLSYCVLFAVAGLLIEFSMLWNGTWWISHVVKLAAYGISVYFFFVVYVRAERELRLSHNELERRVEQRTSELREEVEQRKQAERQIREYADELKRSNEDLEQFSYMASHDLAAPLRAVKCFSQMLHDRYSGKLDEKGDEFIGLVVGGAKRMEEMLTGLLEYSRLDTRGRLQPINSNEAFDRAVANLRMAIHESEATVTRDELPRVSADATQLEQLFQNLIGNAVKFRSDQPPAIHVAAQLDGDHCVFLVRDNGIGIDPRDAENIFAIFRRLDTKGEYPGTGIGLAVCKRIVERHGGHIWVESEPRKGSAFYFTLPSAPIDDIVDGDEE